MSNADIDEIFKTPKQKTQEEIEEENKKLEQALSQESKPKINADILAKLKEKAQKKEEQNMAEVVYKKEVSINMGVVGVGQAGSRIAEVFYKNGYDVGVINTSLQDLKFIDVPEPNKLLLDQTLGGTGKDLDLGREVFETCKEEVLNFVHKVVEGNDMAFLAISGGGGTGSSSVDTLVDILFKTGLPVGVIYILPKNTEDAQSKKNSIETLSRLARMSATNMIASLVVVDNARIEAIYGGLSQSKFWETANNAIVDPIHLFNTMTAQPSKHTSLDPSDFGKIISAGDCSVYGLIEVQNYLEETALAEAVIESLNGSMLAEGFDLTQTRVGGVILIGSEEAISQLPAVNIDYMYSILSEKTNGASLYQGIYTTEDSAEDTVKVYSWFAGLGLPQDRIESLQKQSKQQATIMAEKEKQRTSHMTLDLEKDKTTSATDTIHKKIAQKNSGFNKLQGAGRTSIIDKRRR